MCKTKEITLFGLISERDNMQALIRTAIKNFVGYTGVDVQAIDIQFSECTGLADSERRWRVGHVAVTLSLPGDL